VLIFVSIIPWSFIFKESSYGFSFIFGLLTSVGIIIINAFLIYRICMGIAEISIDLNRQDLATMAHERWKYYLYMIYASIAISIIAFIVPPLAVLLIIPLAIVNIVVMILLASLVKKAENIEYLLYDNEDNKF